MLIRLLEERSNAVPPEIRVHSHCVARVDVGPPVLPKGRLAQIRLGVSLRTAAYIIALGVRYYQEATSPGESGGFLQGSYAPPTILLVERQLQLDRYNLVHHCLDYPEIEELEGLLKSLPAIRIAVRYLVQEHLGQLLESGIEADHYVAFLFVYGGEQLLDEPGNRYCLQTPRPRFTPSTPRAPRP